MSLEIGFEHRFPNTVKGDAAKLVAIVAEERERLLLAAQAAAERIRQAHEALIDPWESSTRKNTATPEEQIAGFIQCVSDNFGDLIDSDELERLQTIADTGIDRDA